MKNYKILEETEKAVKLMVKCYYLTHKEGCRSAVGLLTADKSELRVSESEYPIWCPKSAINASGELSEWFIKQTASKFRHARGFSFANAEGIYEFLYN